jgi:tryptophan-rich sensory protein
MTTGTAPRYNGPGMAVGATLIIGLTLAAAFVGGLYPAGESYEGVAKPSWALASWVFSPVWSVLYLVIAAAGFIAWRQGAGGGTLLIWLLTLVLGALWAPALFGYGQPIGGLIVIALLWIGILIFIVVARRRAWFASLLFLPYLLWVTYVLALNAGIVAMNL